MQHLDSLNESPSLSELQQRWAILDQRIVANLLISVIANKGAPQNKTTVYIHRECVVSDHPLATKVLHRWWFNIGVAVETESIKV